MIMLGTPDGRDAGVLRKTKDEDFFRLLKNPPPEINDIGKYLFIHVADEPSKWRPLLKKLPYALCGIFSPAANRKENFAWADRFFLWIRYCGEMDFDRDNPRLRIIRDKEVLMCFSTPRPGILQEIRKGVRQAAPHREICEYGLRRCDEDMPCRR